MQRKNLASKIVSILLSAAMIVSTPMTTLATDGDVQVAEQAEVQIASDIVDDTDADVALAESDADTAFSGDIAEEDVTEENILDEDITIDGEEDASVDSEDESGEMILGDEEESEVPMTLSDDEIALAIDGEGDTTAAADAKVTLTVSNQGVLASANDGSVMVHKEVTVSDINQDGYLTYDEALVAAHKAYNSEDGYATKESQYDGKTTTVVVIPANGHTWDEGKVATEPTCTKQGSRLYTCTVCTESIPATGHTFGAWKTESKATVFAPKLLSHTCTKCGYKDTEYTGSALKPTIKVNAETITLKIQQKTSALKVTGLANGDSITSYKSGNTKLFTVDKKGVITATKKTGSAKLTITLKSGLKKQVTVKVQKNAVTTTKITGLTSKVTVKKGAKLTLKPSRVPVTSTQKFTYATSNKKVATVSSAGVIKAKAAGTAKITVKSGSKKVVVTVTVPKTKTTAITVKTSVTVKKGKTIALNAKKTPANSDQKITYASANKKIATVTSAGKIKGVKKGTTTITVKSGNITKKIKVTVK